MDTAIDAVNAIASEHLEIVTKDPFGTMTKVRNAGAIFLGESSSEPLGDYFAGPTTFFQQMVQQDSSHHSV